jgi:arylformamidase
LIPFTAWPVLHDISRPLRPEMVVWPDDPPFELDWAARQARGHAVNAARIRLGVHAGTHVDAPHHLLDDGPAIDEVALSTFVGIATLVDARGQDPLDADYLRRVLELHPDPKRLLFRTGAWSSADGFPHHYPTLTPDAAFLVKSAGIRLIGTDAPSIDSIDSLDLPAHRILLSATICILENLLLDDVSAGVYELIALPLRIRGADASPVRAVLRTL